METGRAATSESASPGGGPPPRGEDVLRGAAPDADPTPQALDTLRRELEGLRSSMESRATIDMARGIIMATAPCSYDEAWQVLVEISQHTNVKLREVARHLVEGAAGAPLPPALDEALRQALRRVRFRARDANGHASAGDAGARS